MSECGKTLDQLNKEVYTCLGIKEELLNIKEDK